MLQYFEKQLKSTIPLTQDGADEQIKIGIDNDFGTEEYLKEYYNSRIGKKLLFYLKSNEDNTEARIGNLSEDEVESKLKDAKFIEMVAATPKFVL